jgi:hypothetical protein
MSVPTGDSDLLWDLTHSDFARLRSGAGDFVLGPGLGLVWGPQANMFCATTYTFYFDPSTHAGEDIRQGAWRMFMMYEWESGMYVMPEVGEIREFDRDGKLEMVMSSEMGYLHHGTTFFTKMLSGYDFGIRRDWGLEFGIRWNF